MIHIASPDLSGNEARYVADCMESTWISSAGKYIAQFETEIAVLAGTRHAIATNNGTTALHLALVAAGVGPGDEVIVPTLTYIASANAVRYCGATPVLADVEPGSMGLDPADFARRVTARTKAVVPVHLYGRPADLDGIEQVARQHGVTVVEDAAEAHCARWHGRRVGSLGAMGTFSFFGNKILTTGEGGAVTTDDDELAAHLRRLRGQGMDPTRRYWFTEVGFNYRMTNIAAAIGVAQIERVTPMLARRAEIERRYTQALGQVQGLDVPADDPRSERVNWLYTVGVRGLSVDARNQLIDLLATDGIETRPVFYPLHLMPPYDDQADQSFPVAERLGREGISLPTHTGLTDDEIDLVARAFARRVEQVRG